MAPVSIKLFLLLLSLISIASASPLDFWHRTSKVIVTKTKSDTATVTKTSIKDVPTTVNSEPERLGP